MMKLKIGNRYAFVLLMVYWLSIFTLTHLPLDNFTVFLSKIQPSDKVLHFVTYFILAFLFWWSFKWNRRVCWSEPPVWWLLLTVICYGIFDEWLQVYVGRSCNIFDFTANLIGTVSCLLILSFFTFRSALVILTGVLIFSLTNLTRANIMELFPVVNVLFYFISYSAFTFLWIRYVHLRFCKGYAFWKLWCLDVVVPAAFLFGVKLFSDILQKDFTTEEVLLSGSGITGILILYATVSFYRGKSSQESQ